LPTSLALPWFLPVDSPPASPVEACRRLTGSERAPGATQPPININPWRHSNQRPW
jgi:hypothetical protein